MSNPITLLALIALSAASATFPTTTSLSIQTSSRSAQCPVLLDPQPPRPPTRALATGQGAQPRIINGDPSSAELSRSVVSIVRVFGSGRGVSSCTGTLVTPRHVVTAAHCEVQTVGFVVLVGRTGPGMQRGKPFRIRRVVNHREYNDVYFTGIRYDIAVLELATSVDSAVGKPMLVNTNSKFPESGAALRVAGFGNDRTGTNEVQSNTGAQLNQVDVPAVPFDRCKRAHAAAVTIFDDFQFCVGYEGRRECSGCFGDSGGPVFQYDPSNNPVLVGIVSFGSRTCQSDKPAVNVRVSQFIGWLEQSVPDFERSTNAVQQSVGSRNVGAIVAGVVVAAVVVAALIVGAVIVKRRRERSSAVAAGAAPPGGDSTLSSHAPPPPLTPPPPPPGPPIVHPTEGAGTASCAQQAQGTPQQTALPPTRPLYPPPVWGAGDVGHDAQHATTTGQAPPPVEAAVAADNHVFAPPLTQTAAPVPAANVHASPADPGAHAADRAPTPNAAAVPVKVASNGAPPPHNYPPPVWGVVPAQSAGAPASHGQVAHESTAGPQLPSPGAAGSGARE